MVQKPGRYDCRPATATATATSDNINNDRTAGRREAVNSNREPGGFDRYLRKLGVAELAPGTYPLDPGIAAVMFCEPFAAERPPMLSLNVSRACWTIADRVATERTVRAAHPASPGRGPYRVAVALAQGRLGDYPGGGSRRALRGRLPSRAGVHRGAVRAQPIRADGPLRSASPAFEGTPGGVAHTDLRPPSASRRYCKSRFRLRGTGATSKR